MPDHYQDAQMQPKKYSELFLLGSILVALISMPSCKRKTAFNHLADINAGSSACDIETITRQLDELNSSEADLVMAQHLKYAIQSANPCTIPRINCENKCNSEYSGLTAYWYQKEHGMCLDRCLLASQACMKANAAAVASGERIPLDPVKLLASRVALLQRREEILGGLHLCSTDSAAVRVISEQINPYLGSKGQELDFQSGVWRNLWNSDKLVSVTYRFTRGTAIDVPARRGYMTRADWLKELSADESYIKILGHTVLGSAIDGLAAVAEPVRTFIGIDNTIGSYSIDDEHIENIVQSCRNVTDTCTAISCLGHRTQEIMSVRDNIERLNAPSSSKDGRIYPVCRHYAPTYEKACNRWAKDHGLSDTMNCTTEDLVSVEHGFPIITLKFEEKSYQYIYDLMNDPMTPDLVPNNAVAEERAIIPCSSTKLPQENELQDK